MRLIQLFAAGYRVAKMIEEDQNPYMHLKPQKWTCFPITSRKALSDTDHRIPKRTDASTYRYALA
jgi:hypothetical protein